MKKILITGCNGNLASSIISYLKRKYVIIGCDVHDSFNNCAQESIEYYKVDLSEPEEIFNLIQKLKSSNLIPDIILNNAAIDSVPSSNVNFSEENLEETLFNHYFEVNVRAPIILFNAIVKLWIKNNVSGNVINITSIYSKVSPDPNLYQKGFLKDIFYGSSKAALNNAFKQLSVQYMKKGIRINSILLSGVESSDHNIDFKSKYTDRIPSGKFLKVTEILPAIDLLLDQRNSGMNGSEVVIDGGYLLV